MLGAGDIRWDGLCAEAELGEGSWLGCSVPRGKRRSRLLRGIRKGRAGPCHGIMAFAGGAFHPFKDCVSRLQEWASNAEFLATGFSGPSLPTLRPELGKKQLIPTCEAATKAK